MSAKDFETWQAQYLQEHEQEINERIKAATDKALQISRSSLKGKITEQFAPLFPEFISKYDAADARFLGSPVDFIVFNNLHTVSNENQDRKEVEVVFVEVKNTKKNPRYTDNEKAVRTAVESGRVRYDILRINFEDGGNGSDNDNKEQVGLPN